MREEQRVREELHRSNGPTNQTAGFGNPPGVAAIPSGQTTM